MISIIAAIGKNRELGKDNQLIFHIKEDMKFFRETTTGHKILMGRKTWESLPHKLPNRENIVISRHEIPGADLSTSNIDDFIAKYQDSEEEIFVIGGGMLHSAFLPYASQLYLTEVDASEPTADAFFPDFDKSKYSKEIIKKGSENGLNYSIVKYIKHNG
ncbi:dihydrofolate reductase [Candidatus Saccharibacteria bacterium]|nr:dihydrofolate reductase [Candidatus Saccharibacteria bacterium]